MAVATDGQGSPVAVVTGASSGIGRATAEALVRRGYRTAVMARRTERLDDLVGRLPSPGGVAVPVDVADRGAVEAAFRDVLDRVGVPDVLVNAAGYGVYERCLDMSDDQHEALMHVNYFGTLWAIRAVLPEMVRRGSGHVINVASIAAKHGPWGHGAYAAAKAAVVGLTQSLAAEHECDGVRFSYIMPGFVNTEFFDDPSYGKIDGEHLQRGMPPERLAEAIVRLLRRPRLEVVVPAHYRGLDLLRTLTVELAHRVVARKSRPTGAADGPEQARKE